MARSLLDQLIDEHEARERPKAVRPRRGSALSRIAEPIIWVLVIIIGILVVISVAPQAMASLSQFGVDTGMWFATPAMERAAATSRPADQGGAQGGVGVPGEAQPTSRPTATPAYPTPYPERVVGERPNLNPGPNAPPPLAPLAPAAPVIEQQALPVTGNQVGELAKPTPENKPGGRRKP